MKRTIFILACCIMSVLSVGCVSAQNLKTETVKLEEEGDTYSLALDFELPASSDGVAGKIKEHLVDVIDQLLNDGAYPSFKGNKSDSKALVQYYFTNTVNQLQELAKEAVEEMTEDYIPEKATLSVSVDKAFESGDLVVFTMEVADHQPGMPNDNYSTTSYTFKKADGSLFDRFFAQDFDIKRIQPILKRGLCEYLEVGPSELFDELQVEDEIPLPANAPCPSDTGLVFSYAYYEIGPRYIGAPSFTVPYEAVMPYLSDEARSLLVGGKDATAELSSVVLDLCNYIPDHGISEDAEQYMTKEYFRAVDEAFAAPDGAYGEIGESEWLYYFVTGQEGFPVFKVDKVTLTDEGHALADIQVGMKFEEDDTAGDYFQNRSVKMVKSGGKWLLDDYEDTKQECRDYVKGLRGKYESGEILKYLQSDEYLKEYIPEFKKSLEAFYKKYGK